MAVWELLRVHDVLHHLGEDLRYLGDLVALWLADFLAPSIATSSRPALGKMRPQAGLQHWIGQ